MFLTEDIILTPGSGRGQDQGHPGAHGLQSGRYHGSEEVRRPPAWLGRALAWKRL